MASRQEEKERRRAEREAAEQKSRAAAARSRRLQMVGGTVLLVAIIVVAAIVTSGSGGSSSKGVGDTKSSLATVPIPKPGPNATNLAAAAKAAGCVSKTFPMEGRTHVTTTVKYKTNPPTS